MAENHLKNLESLSRENEEMCSRCGACVTRCAFLKEHGTPGEIGRSVRALPIEAWPDPFGCSLCGLCGAVCPEGLLPEALFLEMRRARTAAGLLDLKPYAPVLAFERRGDSNLFSYLHLPVGGDTVLFPGCALSAMHSRTVRRLFRALQAVMPEIGIALGCCLKPSHDLGRQEFFEERFGRLHARLVAAGVKRVLTACPNCYKIFSSYGDGIVTDTVYEFLADGGFVPTAQGTGGAVIHDPCPQRYEDDIQKAVRTLVQASGVSITEIRERQKLTLCCGEGGMVKFVRPDFADAWTTGRHEQAGGQRVITSCAGCVNYLRGPVEVDHLLDILFDSKAKRPLKPPFTYVARLWLKRWFRTMVW